MIDVRIGDPLHEARRALAARVVVASPMRTLDWELVPAQIREVAFFSAAVEDARWLEEAKAKIAGRLAGAPATGRSTMDRSKFVAAMQDLANKAGIRPAKGRGGLTDPGSRRRLEMIYNIQVGMAEGRARHVAGMDSDVLLMVPAQELVRVGARKDWRDWPRRWVAAGLPAPVPGPGDYGVRMVALKTDPGWAKLSRFGVPYPPFDFESGMGLRDIRRKEAKALGLIREGQKQKPLPDPDPTSTMETTIPGLSTDGVALLEKQFGDMVDTDVATGKVSWNAGWLQGLCKALANGLKSASIDPLSVGAAGSAIAALLAAPAQVNADTRLVIPPTATARGATEADLRAFAMLWREADIAIDGGIATLTLELPDGRIVAAKAHVASGSMVIDSIEGRDAR